MQTPTQKRLLIADDDAVFSSLMRMEVERRGQWQVTEAATCAGAIASIEEASPHLLVLDLRFPGGDGFAILDHIRDARLHVPAVVVTNYHRSMYGDRCSAYGVLDYLVKMEWKIDRLIHKLEEIMR